MKRILVLGGYGGFGGRISARLASAGYDVLVAGRSIEKARDFCMCKLGLTPLAVDRGEIVQALARHMPVVLVDASGPFQAMDYAVPSACITAGVHYVDIADSRDFVCGINALDTAARNAGVVVLSGASSVPALSGAVIRHLKQEMDHVHAIDIVISASNKAAAGPSVSAAILGQVGQSISIWRGRRWDTVFGWQELRKVDFYCAGTAPIKRRIVALVDVPDLGLWPKSIVGQPAVTFRAGTELSFQNRALWLVSWLVKGRILRSLAPFAHLLSPLQYLTRSMGSDRSAMAVRLFGLANGQEVERQWTLIADEGDGPEIPTLSVEPVVARIIAGAEPDGARDAGDTLSLSDYTSAFGGLAIRHDTREIPSSPPLYARVMGERFAALPAELQSIHSVFRDGGTTGGAEVTGAANWLGAIIARVFGFPPPGHHPVHVQFMEENGRETWVRHFSGQAFKSELSQHGPYLVERFGPLRFAFSLLLEPKGLRMEMRRWWIGPIPLPLAMAPRSEAREWSQEGRFWFDVPIALPFIGRLVHYRGWLKPHIGKDWD